MNIDTGLVISIVALAISFIFSFTAYKRTNNKDVAEEARRDATLTAKLDYISNNVVDIKERFKTVENNVKKLEDRVIKVETALAKLESNNRKGA